MSNAPERIWAWPERNWYAGGCSYEVNLGLSGRQADEQAEFVRADLAKPRIKPLVWEPGIVHWARPLPGMKYVACSSEGATWVWWLEGDHNTREVQRSVHESESAAKAAAQADYERRILSAMGLDT